MLHRAAIGVLVLLAVLAIGWFVMPFIALHLGMGLMFMGVIR